MSLFPGSCYVIMAEGEDEADGRLLVGVDLTLGAKAARVSGARFRPAAGTY
jgi:hypothetical protein